MCCVCACVCVRARLLPRRQCCGQRGGSRSRGERRVGWPSWLHRSLKVKSHSRYVRLRCLGFSERMG